MLDTDNLNAETSLRDDLAAAMVESETTDTTATTDTSVEKKTGAPDVSEAARTLAAQRAAKTADGTDKTGTQAVVDHTKAVEAKEADTAIEAPTSWPAADREMFAKQTPEARTWMLNRHKAMEADYVRKTQEVAGVRRFKEGLDEVFSPFRAAMQRDGIDDLAAIRQLVGAHQYLQEKPAEAIHWLAQKYGIDIKNLTGGEGSADGAQPDPRFMQLEKTVTDLSTQLRQTLTERQQEQHKASLSAVSQFAEEKDAQGQLKRPHWDEVAPDIVLLLRAAQGAGQQLSLQDAYDRAVYANPMTRAKVLAAQEAERKAKEATDRAAKANAAKKAGFDVQGQGAATSAVAAQTNSVREDLEAAFAVSGDRV